MHISGTWKHWHIYHTYLPQGCHIAILPACQLIPDVVYGVIRPTFFSPPEPARKTTRAAFSHQPLDTASPLVSIPYKRDVCRSARPPIHRRSLQANLYHRHYRSNKLVLRTTISPSNETPSPNLIQRKNHLYKFQTRITIQSYKTPWVSRNRH